jgi:Flp pilus assembly pilin Flp
VAIPLHPNYATTELPSSALGPSQNTAAAKEVNEVQKIRNLFAEFPRREEGQTMAEYGVVLAVITIAVFGALALLSGNIVSAINRVAAYIT